MNAKKISAQHQKEELTAAGKGSACSKAYMVMPAPLRPSSGAHAPGDPDHTGWSDDDGVDKGAGHGDRAWNRLLGLGSGGGDGRGTQTRLVGEDAGPRPFAAQS